MSYFKNKFNKNNQCNCPECRGIPNIDVQEMVVDLELDDPDDIVDHYFEMVKEAETEEEILDLLHELFEESVSYGYKLAMIEDLGEKIQILNTLNKE